MIIAVNANLTALGEQGRQKIAFWAITPAIASKGHHQPVINWRVLLLKRRHLPLYRSDHSLASISPKSFDTDITPYIAEMLPCFILVALKNLIYLTFSEALNNLIKNP